MTLAPPLEGGCACGAVRYRVSMPPVTLYGCHCTSCQAQSGTAFNLSLRVETAGFVITRGEPARIEIATDSGRAKHGLFCPHCGVRLAHITHGAPHLSVRAGTLDSRAKLDPVGHIYVRSALPWMRFREEDLLYDAMPDDGFAALIERWRGRG